MKTCPDCGKSFSWIETLTGTYKAHVQQCADRHNRLHRDMNYLASCRGCPAGCYEGIDYGAAQSGEAQKNTDDPPAEQS